MRPRRRCRPSIKDHRQILVVARGTTRRGRKAKWMESTTTVRLSIRHLTRYIMRRIQARAARGHDTSQSRRITWRERARRAEGREGPRSPPLEGGEQREKKEERDANEEGEKPARASGRNLGPRVPRHGLVSLFGLHGQRSFSSTSHLWVLNLLPRESRRLRGRPARSDKPRY